VLGPSSRTDDTTRLHQQRSETHFCSKNRYQLIDFHTIDQRMDGITMLRRPPIDALPILENAASGNTEHDLLDIFGAPYKLDKVWDM
jgi:hypothetical protein